MWSPKPFMHELLFFDCQRVPVLPPEDLKSSRNNSKKDMRLQRKQPGKKQVASKPLPVQSSETAHNFTMGWSGPRGQCNQWFSGPWLCDCGPSSMYEELNICWWKWWEASRLFLSGFNCFKPIEMRMVPSLSLSIPCFFCKLSASWPGSRASALHQMRADSQECCTEEGA